MTVGLSLLGLVPAAVVWRTRDIDLAAMLAISAVGTCVCMFSLIHSKVVLDPDDIEIVGTRPVAPETYLAARTSVLGIHIAEAVVLIGTLPIVSFALHPNGSLGVAFAVAVAFCGAGACMVLTLVHALAAMNRFAGRAWTTRVVTVAQTLMVLGLFGGFTGAAAVVIDTAAAGQTIDSRISSAASWWLVHSPAAWMASGVAIAQGNGSTGTWATLLASLSFGAVLALGLPRVVGRRYLPMAVPAVSAGRQSRWRIPHLFRGESRAILCLVRDQAAHNPHFQTELLLAALALAVVSLMLVTTGLSWPQDPFVSPGSWQDANRRSLRLVSLVLPSIAYRALLRSENAEASWFWLVTPCIQRKTILTTHYVAVAATLAPAFVVLAVVLSLGYGVASHSVLEAGLTVLVASIVFLTVSPMRGSLPFSLSLTYRFRLEPKTFLIPIVGLALFGTIDRVLPATVIAATIVIIGCCCLLWLIHILRTRSLSNLEARHGERS